MATDRYDDAGDAGAPKRLGYAAKPTNVNTRETAKQTGGTPGGVQQAGGTENKRADNRTKSARIPDSPSGKDRRLGDSYDDTKDF